MSPARRAAPTRPSVSGTHLEAGHSPTCWLRRIGEENDHFAYLDLAAPEEQLAYDGTRRGDGHRWLRFTCGGGCPARVLVRWDAIAKMIARGLGGAL